MATHGVLGFMRVCFTGVLCGFFLFYAGLSKGFQGGYIYETSPVFDFNRNKKTPEQEQTTKSFLVISLYSALAVKKNLVFQESS